MDVPTVFEIINICAELLGIAGALLIIFGGFRVSPPKNRANQPFGFTGKSMHGK